MTTVNSPKAVSRHYTSHITSDLCVDSRTPEGRKALRYATHRRTSELLRALGLTEASLSTRPFYSKLQLAYMCVELEAELTHYQS